MIILGIETSCDETAAALVKDGRIVLRSTVASQLAVHKPFKGVVPELASRAHVERINDVIAEVLGSPDQRVDAIAVTTGPGLIGCLLVGTVTARMLAWVKGIPVIGVNHLEGHLFAGLVEHPRLKPPFLGLIVSGGHTELVIFKGYGRYQKLGATRDDAAGEAFDKVANLLNLPFPGGPSLDNASRGGSPAAISFPRAWIPGTHDFSFSGIKTSVANFLRTLTPVKPQHTEAVRLIYGGTGVQRKSGPDSAPVARLGRAQGLPLRQTVGWGGFRRNDGKIFALRDICASFQEAVVDVLVKKTLDAAESHELSSVVVGGGVAANSRLRGAFIKAARGKRVRVYMPELSFCTDNAAMIAAAGYYKFKHGLTDRQKTLCVDANLEIQNWKAA